MSSPQATRTDPTASPAATAISTPLEVVLVPVADVERAKRFYLGLGWRLDADLEAGPDYHAVQVTPPGSSASIIFGKGVTTAEPGSIGGLLLAVDDIEVARDELRSRGADVSEVFHDAGGSLGGGLIAGTARRAPGPDPQRRSYASYASFSDPEGNGWLLQEVTERLPGRVSTRDVAALADLLHETAEHHDAFEKAAPPHAWWDWYAAYVDARQAGRSPDEASAAAGRYMAEAKDVVVAPR